MRIRRGAVAVGLSAITVGLAVTTACGSFSGDEEQPPVAPTDDGGADTSVGAEARGEVVLTIPKGLALVQGGTLVVEVTIKRIPPFAKGMTILARDLPSGVGTEPVDLTPTESTAKVKFSASEGAAHGQLKNVTLEARSDGILVGRADVDGFVRGTPGALDTTFGTNGVVDLGVPAFNSMAMLADGSVFVLEGFEGKSVRKYTKDGALDKTFADNGILATAPALPITAIAWRAPHLYLAGGSMSTSQWHVQKMDAAGKLDASYGATGTFIRAAVAPTPPRMLIVSPSGAAVLGGQNGAFAALMHVSPTGMLADPVPADPVNAGFTRTNAGPPEFLAAVYDGSRIVAVGANNVFRAGSVTQKPDTTFSATGHIGLADVYVSNIVLDANGNYLLGGVDATSSLYVARMTPNGNLDSTFGTGGEFLPGIGIDPRGGPLVVTGDTIVQVGSMLLPGSVFRCTVARYTKAGQLDMTFGQAGQSTPPVDECYAGEVLAQPDGRIVTSGTKLMRFWP